MASYSISYDFEFPITSENYVEKILDFDAIFIKSTHQYGLIYWGDIDIEEFIKHYKKMRQQVFFYEKYKNYYLFDIAYINQFLLKYCGLHIQYNADSVEKHIQTFRGEEIMHQFIRLFNFENMSNFYARDLEGLDSWEEKAVLGLYFNSKNLHKMPYNTKIEYIPRFNSFLREISKFVKQMGGKIETDSMPEEFMTIEGLSDGVHASHDIYTRKIREFLDAKYTIYKNQLQQQGGLSGNALEEAVASRLHGDINTLRGSLKTLLEVKCMPKIPPLKVNDLAMDTDFLNLLK